MLQSPQHCLFSLPISLCLKHTQTKHRNGVTIEELEGGRLALYIISCHSWSLLRGLFRWGVATFPLPNSSQQNNSIHTMSLILSWELGGAHASSYACPHDNDNNIIIANHGCTHSYTIYISASSDPLASQICAWIH